MSFLSLANCLTGHHKPIRRDVEWNGEEYVGTCRHCQKPIKRIASREWRAREA